MRDLDDELSATLAEEERALLRSMGQEPAYLTQAMSVFAGRTGWVNGVLMITQGVAFVVGVWCAWRFFAASDLMAVVRYGISGGVLILTSVMLKSTMWPTIQANRVLRELKRLELLMGRAAPER